MYKVLHINIRDTGGGACNFAFDFLRQYDNHRMIVATKHTDHERVQVYDKKNYKKLFHFLDKVAWKLGLKKAVKEAFSLHNQLNCTYENVQNHPWYQEADIVHLHNLHGNYFDLKALKKIVAEKPVVISLHDMWWLTGGEPFTLENKNYVEGKPETPYNQYYPLYAPVLDRRKYHIELKKEILQSIANANFHVITGSPWLEGCLKEAYVYNDQLKVRTIREGAFPEQYQISQPRDWDTARVLIVNTSIFYKNGEMFQRVLMRFPSNIELTVIGDSYELEHGDYKLTELAYVNGTEAFADLLKSHDILIFPSHQDNSPLVVSYGMHAEMCIIGANTGGIHDQLNDGAGALFDVKNDDELIEKVHYYANHLEEARALGKQAKAKALKHYNSHVMYEQYEAVYEELLKAK